VFSNHMLPTMLAMDDVARKCYGDRADFDLRRSGVCLSCPLDGAVVKDRGNG
jgi:hypothetical protein